MNSILEQVQLYLTRISNNEVEVNEELVEEFGELAKDAFRKLYNQPDKFTLRMSAIGRPFCQQWMAKNDQPKGSSSYYEPMKFLIGDLIECAAIVILKGAQVNVERTSQAVSMAIGGIQLEGTYDVKIDGAIYDIKSASPYAFTNKFNSFNPFKNILDDDPFGYVNQGYLYAEADKSKFGGWIAINKSTGEWAVAETPILDSTYKKIALANAEKNIKDLIDNKEFSRDFKSVEETFRKKKTGKRYLGITCSYCPYKEECWKEEGLVHKPQPASKAKHPRWFWYLRNTK